MTGRVHVVVPQGLDDPARPSGGNHYDRRICTGLEGLGWTVHAQEAAGAWPEPDRPARARLAAALGAIPDGGVVLIDGLLASCTPEVLSSEAGRLRVVVLVHLPLGHGRPASARAWTNERRALAAASAVVTTSSWTRRFVLDGYRLDPDRVHVAEPGVDPACMATPTLEGGRLVCVATVTPAKGHDVLLRALGDIRDRTWSCRCAGSITRDPGLLTTLAGQATELEVAGRVEFLGALSRDQLTETYAGADLLVLPSRLETYGMVVTEALSHGLPVVATDVGGVPEALGRGSDGTRPGLLVAPDDSVGLAAALRAWLERPALRRRLRQAAVERRAALRSWADPAGDVAAVLTQVAA